MYVKRLFYLYTMLNNQKLNIMTTTIKTQTVNNVLINLEHSNGQYFIYCKNLINNNSSLMPVGARLLNAIRKFENKIELHS